MLDVVDVVVVDPEEIDRLPARSELIDVYRLGHPVPLEHRQDFLGIAGMDDRIGEQPVLNQIDTRGRRPILIGVVLGPGRDEIEHDAESVVLPWSCLPHRPDRRVVGQHQVMSHHKRSRGVGDPRGMLPRAVPEEGDAPGLVERHPGVDHVTEGVLGYAGVLGKPVNRLGVEPAAPVLQGLWQIPVIEGGNRSDPGPGQLLAKPAVEVHAGLIDSARALGQKTGPCDREPVGIDPDLGHQCDVLGITVVVVHRLIAGMAIGCLARGVGEGVPDGRSPPIFGHGALDLIGSGGHAPKESRGELRQSCHLALRPFYPYF